MPHTQFATELDRLAEVAIKVGVRLQEGQDLVLTAPMGALPLVRRIAAARPIRPARAWSRR